MKKQNLLFAIVLPVLLILSGCEATTPTQEATAEPVVAAAPAAPVLAEAPKVESAAPALKPEHCPSKHPKTSSQACSKHSGKHKGKKSKACIKHCEQKPTATHDCEKHCAENKDSVPAKKCDKHEHK